MLFDEFDLAVFLKNSLRECNFTTPTPIQQDVIPVALQGRDILGIAQTGTGKTAAFLFPIATLLSRGRTRARMPRCLILEPTRELAMQVVQNIEKFCKNSELTCTILIGGTSNKEQEDKLLRGVDILVATPGRFLDHLQRGKLLLSDVQHLVIDEADRMMDMGFLPDVEQICASTPFTRQTMLFSATMPKAIEDLTHKFLSSPFKSEVAAQSSKAESITHWLVKTTEDEKREVLRHLLQTQDIDTCIVFCNAKREVTVLVNSLLKHGFSAAALHGDIPQPVRTKVLEQFQLKNIKILVASDVAARGLDIPDVSHVFNFTLPRGSEDYVHRIGRTGRGGRTGVAFSLFTDKEVESLGNIQTLLKQDIPLFEVNIPADEKPQRSHHAKERKPYVKERETRAPAASVAKTGKPPVKRRYKEPDDNVIFSESGYVPDFLLVQPLKNIISGD